MRAILVDDELKALSALEKELSLSCPEVNVIEKTQTVSTAYTLIEEHKPDIVFLDIDLQNETAFDLLDLLSEIDFNIIFVTAHNEFAIKAIRYSALDYLLKPIRSSELIAAVQRGKERINSQRQIDQVKSQFKSESIGTTVALQEGNKIHFIERSDILFCEADGNFTKVYLMDKRYYISQSLKSIESFLSEFGFFRIQRKCFNKYQIRCELYFCRWRYNRNERWKGIADIKK